MQPTGQAVGRRSKRGASPEVAKETVAYVESTRSFTMPHFHPERRNAIRHSNQLRMTRVLDEGDEFNHRLLDNSSFGAPGERSARTSRIGG